MRRSTLIAKERDQALVERDRLLVERDQAEADLARVRVFLNDLVLVFPSVAREGGVYQSKSLGASYPAGYKFPDDGWGGVFEPGELGLVRAGDIHRVAEVLRERAATEQADSETSVLLDEFRGTTTREVEAEASCAQSSVEAAAGEGGVVSEPVEPRTHVDDGVWVLETTNSSEIRVAKEKESITLSVTHRSVGVVCVTRLTRAEARALGIRVLGMSSIWRVS